MTSSRTFLKDEQDEARRALRDFLKPGDAVYVIQRHVSRSGMMRHLSLFIVKDNKPFDITRLAAAAMGERLYDDGYWFLKVGGAGMDMHFHIVYSLSRALFPDGHKCTGRQYTSSKGKTNVCPSNDHSNDYNTGSALFDKKLADEGRERLYGYETEEEQAQHNERREFIQNLLDNGPLGYRRSRHHSDGGYALHKESF